MGWLAVIALGLWAARPLFIPRLLHGTDSLTHFYTLIQLDQLIQQGVLYSPWLPYRASGLGTPLFHYYAPLAYYVAEGFSLLGLETFLALRVAWGLTLVGGALGVYLWVRDVLKHESSALIAGAAYVCGPYVLFNAFFRGGLAEQFALMLMPLVLWAFHRLAVRGQGRYVAVGALAYAALILSHNVTALIFSPVLLAYVILLSRDGAPPQSYGRVLTLLVASLGLGLGLSSFFWLPALVERDAIVSEMLYTLPSLDYHQHFVPLQALLVAPLTPTLRPGLSLVAVALALIGLGHVWLTNRATHRGAAFEDGASATEVGASVAGSARTLRWHSLFAALVATLGVVMVLPLSIWLWEAISWLRFFQFPQRFLGVVSLFIAFLAGLGAQSLGQRLNHWNLPSSFQTGLLARMLPPSAIVLFMAVGLLLSHTEGLAQVRYYPPLPAIDVDFIMQKEREQGLLNTVYSGNFIPTTVKVLPSVEQLAQASSERLDASSLPAGATLLAADYSPLHYEVTLSSPQPFTLRFNTFYFPGWQAQLDGQAAPLTPSDPHGLISMPLPAGQHHLVVWFGSTPIRTLANALTAISAVMLGLILPARWMYPRLVQKGVVRS